MSDTYSAPPPAPSAPPPSAPPANEAAINPNPVNAPVPITNTPPEKAGGTHRTDVVAKAFERAKVERKGPAEAKPGHNRPPEPTEKEPPLNLKKRPDEQSAPARERGEGGRFAPRAGADRSGARQAQPPSPGVPAQQSGAPYSQPLRRMRDDAKAEWSKAPESVRRDVHRMHQEYARAYQQYRGDHEAMNSLRPYDNLARSQGTSLPVALGNYVGIEHKLRQDPIAGLDTIVYNLNLRTSEGRRITLQDIAYHILSQSPEQHKLTAAQNQQTALQRQLQQVQQHQRALAQQQAHMQYQQRFVHTRSAVDRFAETNPRLDELGDLIERELRLGFDLPTAYKRASLLRPATGTPAAQTRTPAPQTRNGDRSISGAPDGGSVNGAARRKSSDRRGSVADAFRRANGAL
jgi:hypothetical protein